MFSHTCKSAIKCVVYLASQHHAIEKVPLKEIADYINVSEHTVGKLLQKLVKSKVINSSKGPYGGFYLSKEQINQPIINIIEAIDGSAVFTQCGLGLSKCSETHPCPIHFQYKETRDAFKRIFIKNKVSHLHQVVDEGMAFLNG